MKVDGAGVFFSNSSALFPVIPGECPGLFFDYVSMCLAISSRFAVMTEDQA